MENNWKNNISDYDSWKSAIDALAQRAPNDEMFNDELEKIITQLESGDLSSLGSELASEIKSKIQNFKREPDKAL